MIVVWLAAGCRPARLTTAELAGTWEVDHGFGREILVLLQDGTYIQKLAESGRTVEHRGWWRVSQPADGEVFSGSKVILQDAFTFATDFGDREPNPTRSGRQLEAVQEWGRISLIFNPDLPGFERR